MEQKSITEIFLNPQEKQRLGKELSGIIYDPLGSDQYVQCLRRKMYEVLPVVLINALTSQRCINSLSGAIVINNVPIDTLIYGSPNFDQTGRLFKSGTLSENVITAFSSLVGEPYSIYFEGKELVNNLTPQAKTKFDYTGLGSEVELDFHIENSALQYIAEDDYSPSGIFFLGIRIDKEMEPPKTFIADTRKALKLLSNSDLTILHHENFYLNLPYRWRGTFSNKLTAIKCSVLKGKLDAPRVSVAFYPDMIIPINGAAKRALNNFHQAVKAVSESIQITPGKLVYVDNRFTLHAREQFKPTYDTNGCPYRWIQRVFVTPSLWPFRAFQSTGGRVFLPHNTNKEVQHHVSSNIPKVA
jgi:L-asparagine oxygenase